MKAYLIVGIISYVIGLVSPPNKYPQSESDLALIAFVRLCALGWAIYLLCQL